jgi:sugar phosphate isomerase/epimerase
MLYYCPMLTRRNFLQALATSAAAAPFVGSTRVSAAPKFPIPGVLGLELYSVRHLMAKDVPSTLKLVASWGFTEVEGGVFQGMSAAQTRTLIDQQGLTMPSTLTGYEKLRDDLAGAVKDAKTLGATMLGTAWIPHQGAFTQAHADTAVADFTKWGKALKAEGLQFFYHVHGYEFQPSPDGTLMDTLVTKTPPDVAFQADVFWVKRGGGDPVALITKYPGRFKSLHLKDLQKGVATGDPTGSAPDETSVVLGQGQIDFPALLRAAKSSGTTHFFIEDEHPQAEKQIPESLKYLAELKI